MDLTPSACITAPCQTTVGNILHLIAEKRTTYVLLEGDAGMVSGIITHSDMARIALEIRRDPKVADEPIHKFMTRPVKRIDLTNIELAPSFMLSNDVHHVPVVENIDTDQEVIIGMISSNSIFEEMVRKQELQQGPKENLAPMNHFVISPDGTLFRLLNTFYRDSRSHLVERHRVSHFKPHFIDEKDVTDFLIDIDDLKSRQWLPIVKGILTYLPEKPLYIVFTPNKEDSGLYNLEKSGVIKIFEKPLDIGQLTQFLNRPTKATGEKIGV